MRKIEKSKMILRDNILWIFVVSFFVMTCGDLVAEFFVPEISKKYAFWYTFKEYTMFITMWIAVMGAIYICKKNRYMINEIKKNERGNNDRYLGIGLLAGFVLNMISAVTALLHGDITIHFNTFVHRVAIGCLMVLTKNLIPFIVFILFGI